ncbi:hypothetical protein RRG08_018574 [Elysia crispata]|uniref:Uncharacterized protein n=1 Tax=Elysia crispata TaxID=231223 RepID=A0AAE0XZL2_9GAST|nr:hypothetical protein RRG08_018574 [Elysia crispata]
MTSTYAFKTCYRKNGSCVEHGGRVGCHSALLTPQGQQTSLPTASRAAQPVAEPGTPCTAAPRAAQPVAEPRTPCTAAPGRGGRITFDSNYRGCLERCREVGPVQLTPV